MTMIAGVASIALLAAMVSVPQLTQKQHLQLKSATDGEPQFDRPAIFPLLRNALLWQTPVSRAGATIPDYEAIATSPEQYRGKLFLIEGDLARIVSICELAQGGAWDGKLKEWDIRVNRDPTMTAVVFLVDPPTDPRRASRVQLVARFYKLMRRRDVQQGELTDFAVFVGRTGTRLRSSFFLGPRPRPTPIWLLMAALALGTGYVLIRRCLRGHPVLGRRRIDTYEPAVGTTGCDTDPGDSLPQDPAKALEKLQRRQRQDS